MFPNGYWILLVVSLALCSIGFYRFVWFMSVGYGFSAALNSEVFDRWVTAPLFAAFSTKAA